MVCRMSYATMVSMLSGALAASVHCTRSPLVSAIELIRVKPGPSPQEIHSPSPLIYLQSYSHPFFCFFGMLPSVLDEGRMMPPPVVGRNIDFLFKRYTNAS